MIDELLKVDDKSMQVTLLLDPKQDNKLRSATYALDKIILTNFEKMEWKIGEIKQVNGEWYQCVKGTGCQGCDLQTNCKSTVICIADGIQDREEVVFKKLEKVGEPYMLEDKKFQKYKVFKTPYIYNKIDCSWQSFADPYYVSLEIKPTKEDMEERYKILEDLVSQYMEADIGYREFEEGVEKWYKEHRKNTENKLNIKSFNLEAAKSGKPVCTRDGRKARVICWNIKDKDNPIAAAVSVGKCESVYLYTNKGEYNKGKEDELDLMMLPEKRSGWINIYNADTTFYYVDGRVFETKDEAVQEAKEEVKKEQREKNEYIDTIRVEWEE